MNYLSLTNSRSMVWVSKWRKAVEMVEPFLDPAAIEILKSSNMPDSYLLVPRRTIVSRFRVPYGDHHSGLEYQVELILGRDLSLRSLRNGGGRIGRVLIKDYENRQEAAYFPPTLNIPRSALTFSDDPDAREKCEQFFAPYNHLVSVHAERLLDFRIFPQGGLAYIGLLPTDA